MTRPKKTTSRKVVVESTAPDHDNEFGNEIEADIEEFLSDQSDSAVVHVYRVGKPGERDGFLDTLTAAAMFNPSPPQVLRDNYGPGHYRLKLKAPNKQGKLVFAGSKTLTVAERSISANGNGRTHGPDDFFREESSRQQQLILALIASQKPQQIDFAGIAALMQAMNGGGRQNDLAAIVQAFQTLKQTAEPPNTMAQMKEAIDLARSLSGQPPAAAAGEETDTGWPGLIRGALSAFTGGGGQPQRQLPAAARQPGGNPGDEFEEEQAGNSEGAMLQQWLQGQLGFLKSKALAGKPVDFWIQYTIDNADEAGNQAIFTALKGGATFENLLMFDPEIAQNMNLRVWFQKFYDGLKRSLSPPPAVPWIGRDLADSAGYAGPGATGQPGAGSAAGGADAGKPSGN